MLERLPLQWPGLPGLGKSGHHCFGWCLSYRAPDKQEKTRFFHVFSRAFPNRKNILFTSLNTFAAQICCTKPTLGYYFKHNRPFIGFYMKKRIFFRNCFCAFFFLLANISISCCCYLFFDLIVFRRLCGSVTEGDLAKLPSFVSRVCVCTCVCACMRVHACACAALKLQLWNFIASHLPSWRTPVIIPEKVQTNQIVSSR